MSPENILAENDEPRTLKKINTFFPYQRCINLDRRTDRWMRFETRMNESGLDRIIRFSAVNGTEQVLPDDWRYSSGAYGCLQSHFEMVREARAKNWPHVLVMEDDVILHPEFNRLFNVYLEELPDDWDLLYFGGIHDQEPNPVTEHVVRLTRTYCTFAYALHHRVYDAFIKLNTEASSPVDVNNFQLQASQNCYGFHPPLAWVEEDFSDIAEIATNPWWMRYGFAMRGSGIEHLLNETLLIFPCEQPNERTRYLIRLYEQMLPGIKTVIVDRSESIDSAVSRFGQNRSRFCWMDPHIGIRNWEFRACLFLSREYDFIVPYEAVVDLNPSDIENLMANNTYPDISPYQPRTSEFPYEGCLFVTRSGLNEWLRDEGKVDLTKWTGLHKKYKVFNAPGTVISLGGCPRQVLQE
ncbi:MAG: glycosyltransferase family 25 protein [Verrucomicrobia bacterium]|nr:glycosyltransferase family 25 protein [Verrucomicrobiota bacterium]